MWIKMGRWRDAERTNNGNGERLLLYFILIVRLDGLTPPEITLKEWFTQGPPGHPR